MEDVRSRQPVVRELLHALPDERASLTAAVQPPPPGPDDLVTEARERATARRHRVVVEVAAYHLRQPFRLPRNRLVRTPPQSLADALQLRPHAGLTRLAFGQVRS